MCRLAAYLGQPLSLKDFLLKPEHSLYRQSWQPQELTYAKLNADGFGFGWYLDDGRPAVYRNPAPIWADANLGGLAESLRRGLWLAMVRSATPGYANGLHNTQPFHDESLLFLHNGFIDNFRGDLRKALLAALDDDIEAAVRGLTDSEYLFALLRQMRRDHAGGVGDALRRTVAWVGEHVGERCAMLNLIVGDGGALYSVRCAFNETAPSLYWLRDGARRFIASERLTPANDGWNAVPEHHLLVVAGDGEPALSAL